MEDLACYRELWAKPADNIQDSYLYEFIFEACRFFSNKGYICDPSEIYSVLGRMGEVDIKRCRKSNDLFGKTYINPYFLNKLLFKNSRFIHHIHNFIHLSGFHDVILSLFKS